MLKKILKIKLKVIGVIIVGLVLAQVISAYFFGVVAEKQIDKQFNKLTKTSLIKVLKRDYERGWFSAKQSVVLEVNNKILKNVMMALSSDVKESSITDTKYIVSYNTQITHGLFAGLFHGQILPTIAYSKTTFVFPDKLQKLLNKFFNGNQALEVVNVIYLTKAGKYIIYSPSFIYDEAVSGVKLTWNGLKMNVGYNTSFDEFDNFLSVPFFQMIAPTKGELSFNNLIYNSNLHYSPNQIKVGHTNVKLDQLQVKLSESGTTANLNLGSAVHLLTGISSADFLNGIDVINPTNFSLSGVSYLSDSDDTKGFFNADAKAGFAALNSNGKQYGPMSLDLSFNHLNASQFNKLTNELSLLANQDQNTGEIRDKTIAMLKSNLTPIFVESPVVRLNDFTLATPSGLIKISGKATTINFESSDMNNQAMFMKKVSVGVNFSVPKSVMSYLFLLQMKYFLTSGNAQMDKQSSDALAKLVNILLDNQLQVWLKKGYLTESNNQLSSTISMESGIVKLNGNIAK